MGGFGREVHDVLLDHQAGWSTVESDHPQHFDFLGFLDDDEPTQEQRERLNRIGAEWIGTVDDLAKLPKHARYVIGIGSGAMRRRIDRLATSVGITPATLIHSAATLGRDVRVGDGTVICAGVRVTTNVTLGRHVHLNINSTVGHDAVLGDYVTVNPLAAVSGNVTLGDEATVGTTASINQAVTIGPGTMIGAGASVIRDAAAGVTVVGVPAVAL